MNRISVSSSQPPRYPAIMPSGTPISIAISDDDERDAERRAGTEDDAAEDVPAEMVGAEQVLPARREVARRHISDSPPLRRIWSQDRRGKRDEDEEHDDRRPHLGGPLAAEHPVGAPRDAAVERYAGGSCSGESRVTLIAA